MSREFIAQLETTDKCFLLRMTHNLLEQGRAVDGVLQTFSRGLKHFVQSREYLEQRRLNQILKEAQRAALTLKNEIKTTDTLQYTLTLTGGRFRSSSQWVLHDPSLQALPEGMHAGEAPSINLKSVGELVAQSEIDFRSLKVNVRDVLEMRPQASIAEVLEQHPADQGLGSVVGLIALGSRHGYRSESHEAVVWMGDDTQWRSARIPKIFFLRERINELV